MNNLIDKERGIDLSEYANDAIKAFEELVDRLPSAENVGKWEWDSDFWCWRCSKCNLSKDSKYFNYYPNCGAKIEVEE